jgi:hypothetical protein
MSQEIISDKGFLWTYTYCNELNDEIQAVFSRRVRIVMKSAYHLRHVRPSVCPSVRTYQRVSYWVDFREI